ncbi:hypothetical protein BH11CYA1_BH11CYA1_22440 [soil metagenome]
MSIKKSFSIGLLGLAAISVVTVTLANSASGQSLRDRLRERLEGENPNAQQQTGTAQSSNAQFSNAQSPMQPQNVQPQPSALAQPAPQVSMVTLQTQPGPGGTQMVITPKGMVVPLPGPGVKGSLVQVYIGSNGGYWYVDKHDQQVDLTPAVQAMQAHAGSGQQAVPVPQYAPQPQVTNNYNTQQSGSSAVGTAAAAGLGAMAGAAMSQSYYNDVPYGTPLHYGVGAVPYYNQGGKAVYVNNSTDANFNQVNAYHATAVQQQQDWYNKQQVAQGATWKNWQQQTVNPFVNSSYHSQYSGAEGAAAATRYENNNSPQYSGAEGAAAATRYSNNNSAEYSGAQGAAAAGRYGNNNAQASGAEGAAAASHNQSGDTGRFGGSGASGERAGAAGEGADNRSGGRFGGRSGGERTGGRRGR